MLARASPYYVIKFGLYGGILSVVGCSRSGHHKYLMFLEPGIGRSEAPDDRGMLALGAEPWFFLLRGQTTLIALTVPTSRTMNLFWPMPMKPPNHNNDPTPLVITMTVCSNDLTLNGVSRVGIKTTIKTTTSGRHSCLYWARDASG